MKKWQLVVLIAVGGLGLAALWATFLCTIHHSKSDLTIPGSMVAFAFGAILLGKVLLGLRDPLRQVDSFPLWLIGAGLCGAAGISCQYWFKLSPLWPSVATIIGMIVGSLIWPPIISARHQATSFVAPEHDLGEGRIDARRQNIIEADQMAEWVRATRQPDHPLLRTRTDIPDMTQLDEGTDH